MSVVPGLPPPPETHPASPGRARQGSGSPYRTASPYAAPYAAPPSPGLSYQPSGAYQASGSPGGAYSAGPGGLSGAFESEKAKEEDRHRRIAEFMGGNIGQGGGSPQRSYSGSPHRYSAAPAPVAAFPPAAGYGSPGRLGGSPNRSVVGVPPTNPVYDSYVAPIGTHTSYVSQPQPLLSGGAGGAYGAPIGGGYGGSVGYGGLAASPSTTLPLTGHPSEGESPRRLRAWGASASMK